MENNNKRQNIITNKPEFNRRKEVIKDADYNGYHDILRLGEGADTSTFGRIWNFDSMAIIDNIAV